MLTDFTGSAMLCGMRAQGRYMGIDLSLRCNCTSTNTLSHPHPNVILLIRPPPLCLRTVFSKLFGRRCLVEGLVSASWRQQPVVAKKESCFEDIRLFVIKVRIFNDNMISAVVLSHFPREWAFRIVSVENIVILRWSEQLNSAEKEVLPIFHLISILVQICRPSLFQEDKCFR